MVRGNIREIDAAEEGCVQHPDRHEKNKGQAKTKTWY